MKDELREIIENTPTTRDVNVTLVASAILALIAAKLPKEKEHPGATIEGVIGYNAALADVRKVLSLDIESAQTPKPQSFGNVSESSETPTVKETRYAVPKDATELIILGEHSLPIFGFEE